MSVGINFIVTAFSMRKISVYWEKRKKKKDKYLFKIN